jgi:hypothetical protein
MLIANYQILYREFPNKRRDNLSNITLRKQQYLYRFGPKERKKLIVCIGASGVSRNF